MLLLKIHNNIVRAFVKTNCKSTVKKGSAQQQRNVNRELSKKSFLENWVTLTHTEKLSRLANPL